MKVLQRIGSLIEGIRRLWQRNANFRYWGYSLIVGVLAVAIIELYSVIYHVCYQAIGDVIYYKCSSISAAHFFDKIADLIKAPSRIPLRVLGDLLNWKSYESNYASTIYTCSLFVTYFCLTRLLFLILQCWRWVSKKFRYLFVLTLLFILCVQVGYAVTDTNLNNNEFRRNTTVKETSSLSVTFVGFLYNINDSFVDFQTHAHEHAAFINSTYPLAAENLSISYNNKFVIAAESDREESEQEIVEGRKAKPFLRRLSMEVSLVPGLNYRAVGLVNDNFFNQIGMDAGGVFTKDLPQVVLARESISSIAAHELGHSYGFCDEDDYDKFHTQALYANCANNDRDNDGFIDSNCVDGVCPINSSDIISLVYPWTIEHPTNKTLVNLMGAQSYNVWIDDSTYSHLFTKVFNMTNRQPVINNISYCVVPFLVNKSDNFSILLESSYCGIQGGYESDSTMYEPGELHIEAFDLVQSLIFNLTAKPHFTIFTSNGSFAEANETSFVMVIPEEGMNSLSIKYNDSVRVLRNRSANTPIINILTNLTNFSVQKNDNFDVYWNGSDADNNSLSYALLLADTAGTSLVTIDLDLNQTNYTMDTSPFTPGNYTLKLLGTDGFNTGVNISEVFVITPVPEISVVEFTDLTPNDATKILRIQLNNSGGVDVHDVNWSINFDDGTNYTAQQLFNLSAYESAFLIMQHTYNSSAFGSFDVNVTITSDKANTSSVLEFSLGDISSEVLFTKLNNLEAKLLIKLNNTGIVPLTDFTGWSMDFGDDYKLNGTVPFNLSVGEAALIALEHTYEELGSYTGTFTISHGQMFSTQQIDLSFIDMDVDIITSDIVGTQSSILFSINNTGLNPLQDLSNWSVDFGDHFIINGTVPINLSIGELVLFAVYHNYNAYGRFNTRINVSYNNLHKSITTTLTTGALMMQNLTAAKNATLAKVYFLINNTGPSNLTSIKNWSIDWGDNYILNGTQLFNLTQGESIIIAATHTYSNGDYTIRAMVNHSAIHEGQTTTITI